MDIIVVFWVNLENMVGVILRNKDYTIGEQVIEWEKHHGMSHCFGKEYLAEEQYK